MSSFIMTVEPTFLGSPIHRVQSPRILLLIFQTLGLSKTEVWLMPTSSCREAELQLPKCVCSHSTAFMKLSDSTSTSESAWVLLGYSRSL